LSEKVVKICSFLVGMVVLRGMMTAMMPPAVSRPRERGVTSRSSRSCTLALPWPLQAGGATQQEWDDMNA